MGEVPYGASPYTASVNGARAPCAPRPLSAVAAVAGTTVIARVRPAAAQILLNMLSPEESPDFGKQYRPGPSGGGQRPDEREFKS
ncbi:hypothetical protein GCM10018781_57260 [Kitasatospora indigofera]|uniref:Uncharacterized protein n=1 Tax=Kitasatospora indigofera TaxID=67307 RepID=A0A919G7U9_9ACTN|nr:hypothetical protein GCM10018781_57260 [Kitasatospora indigofera]